MKECKICKNFLKCSSLGYCIKKKNTFAFKAKKGKIQMTIPSEKKKALERDMHRCIYCKSTQQLDFHHVYYKALERIYDESRNLADKGVILCRECHTELTNGDSVIDLYSRNYLKLKNSCKQNKQE